jgi:hypothetical protein
MLESMEELADAIEDAQYVNAIATQEDGPKPVIAWEQPTPIELHEWEQRIIQKQQQYNQRIRTKFQQKSLSYSTKVVDIEAFSMEWVCQQPIGFYLFSEYIKVICDDYVRINFMEQIIRFRKLISPLSTTTSSTSSSSRSSSINNNNKMMEERLLFAIQLIHQFIGYSQLPETKIISPSPAPPITVPTSTTTTIPVDANSSDVLLVTSESLPKPEDPPRKDQRVSSSTDVLQPEQQHSPNTPLTENNKEQIVQYIWNTLPPRTEIDEYDLARPTMEYYYYNHPSNSTNIQNKTVPPLNSTTTENRITTETNVDSTNMSSIPETSSTDPCRTPKHVIEMSNEELRQLVHENCDYPICSMSIVGLKGPVLDHMIQLMASNISMVQKVAMLSSTMQQQPSHRRSSATKSEYRSSSEFYTHPTPPYMDQPDTNHRSFSKLNDSYGSLSYNSSERTHYRNIPAEEVFEALDSSLMTSSQSHRQHSKNDIRRQSSGGGGGGGNSSNQKSMNNNHELLVNGPPATERTAAMSTTNTTANGNSNTIVQELRQLQDVSTTSNNNSTIGNNSSRVVDVPIHFFDVAEYIIMESLKEQYWIPFTKSSYYTKCKHFLWYQDRKIIPDDFYVLRVLGRGGFGLVTGTSLSGFGCRHLEFALILFTSFQF